MKIRNENPDPNNVTLGLALVVTLFTAICLGALLASLILAGPH